jgi:hypothetical protein
MDIGTVVPARVAAVESQDRCTKASWREQALTRIMELRALAAWIQHHTTEPDVMLIQAAERHLTIAHDAARHTKFGTTVTGASVQRVLGSIGAAEVHLLRAAPPEFVQSQLSELLSFVRKHVVRTDTRLVRLEQLAHDLDDGEAAPLTRLDQEFIASIVHAAEVEARNEYMRVRSFRNLLLLTAFLLFLLAAGAGVFASAAPGKLPICFQPANPTSQQVVCPTRAQNLPITTKPDADAAMRATASPWDVPLLEGIGLVAAAVAAAAAIRGVRGTATPYSLPATLALLKLPTGALTALLGLLLMRGQFVPGLSALDTPAQILAWAVVFGYAQQAFTQFLDRRAQDLLDDVGGAEHREPATPRRPDPASIPAPRPAR